MAHTVETEVETVVKGRNVEVPDHYKIHVREKLEKLQRYDSKIIRFDVELYHEKNPRQTQACQRVEITLKTRGPVVRAEGCARDFYAALDLAIGKLEGKLRRAADRRRVHHGRRTPISVGEATAQLINRLEKELQTASTDKSPNGHSSYQMSTEDENLPGRIARIKEHTAKPMTVDDALFEMELVGHDFYLFSDVDTGKPSVVYRRKGYDYGLLSLGT